METNMYNNYDNKCFNYYTTSTFDHPRKKHYLIGRYFPKAVWDYGDTVTITFNIHECCNLSTEEIQDLQEKDLVVNFYNDRYELLPVIFTFEGDDVLSVYIDYETSMKYFKRGTYHCSIAAVTYKYTSNENCIVGVGEADYMILGKAIGEGIESQETILPMYRCCFYVK